VGNGNIRFYISLQNILLKQTFASGPNSFPKKNLLIHFDAEQEKIFLNIVEIVPFSV
jgi:hypothetical protein